jgi:hypothetical protein
MAGTVAAAGAAGLAGAEARQTVRSARLVGRSDRLAKWAADAALTPASAGQADFLRLRMHSIQLTKCNSSPSG